MSNAVCRATPITNAEQLAAIARERETRAYQFLNASSRGSLRPPIDNYGICFGRTADPLVQERISRFFGGARAAIRNGFYGDKRGYIYAFHDLADDSSVIKIGRTERDPRKRLAEWTQQLAPGERRSIVLLFAYATVANKFAERIVHETLRCERIPNRLNAVTGDELDEFFVIENFMALKVFIRQTLRYINQFIVGTLKERSV